MICPSDGILRAQLDGELNNAESVNVAAHLAVCADCRSRMQLLTAEQARVVEDLAMLAPPAIQAGTDAAAAYARFRNQHELAPTPSWFARVFAPRYRLAWDAAAALCVLTLLLTFGPVRSWAQRVLAMLRVKNIAVVSIDPSVLMSGQDNEVRPYKLFNQLVADTVVVTMDPGRPEVVTSTNAASQMAGFRIRTLSGLPAPQQVLVRGEAAFHMNLNRARIQAVFDELGRSDIHVPDSLDGATVAAHIPKAVVSMYGDCSGRFEVRHESTGNFAVEAKRTKPGVENFAPNCTLLLQAPAPTVSVPPGLDMAGIAEAGLELAGMSSGEARSLCQTIDWSSTLVVPIPRNISSSQPVKVDGVDGTLVQIPSHANAYLLLWVKDGVIYSLNGHGGTQDALALAASLR